ncbi:MAG: polysulfide reductase NrfD [Proteobacteria bacterium]|nr:polysulfide reductase NrfD [Pseudomonadota bacterium]
MGRNTGFSEIATDTGGYWPLIGGLGIFVAVGLGAAYTMESSGHVITGMNNRIVWGMPHVFAVFLILAAAGALTASTAASVFGRTIYKPLSRYSGVVAISLLLGGLSALMLDLGRAGALIGALGDLNFKSIFTWNLFVYTGFILAVVLCLWMMMERRMNRYERPAGIIAFLVRLLLATDIGSVFGVLVARQAYDTAIMAPLFVALSFSIGLAVFILVLFPVLKMTGRPMGATLVGRLGRLLGIFAAVVLYFVAVQHLTNLYAAEHEGVERFILLDGGVYTALFWGVQVIFGGLVPLGLLFYPGACRCRFIVMVAAALIAVGGFAQIYVIIIGGQAYPLLMFPGMEVTSSFFDGQIASYRPSLPEVGLGIGGVAIALTLIAVSVRVLPVLPVSLADADVDPHYQPPPEPEPEPEPEEESGDADADGTVEETAGADDDAPAKDVDDGGDDAGGGEEDKPS